MSAPRLFLTGGKLWAPGPRRKWSPEGLERAWWRLLREMCLLPQRRESQEVENEVP